MNYLPFFCHNDESKNDTNQKIKSVYANLSFGNEIDMTENDDMEIEYADHDSQDLCNNARAQEQLCSAEETHSFSNLYVNHTDCFNKTSAGQLSLQEKISFLKDMPYGTKIETIEIDRPGEDLFTSSVKKYNLGSECSEALPTHISKHDSSLLSSFNFGADIETTEFSNYDCEIDKKQNNLNSSPQALLIMQQYNEKPQDIELAKSILHGNKGQKALHDVMVAFTTNIPVCVWADVVYYYTSYAWKRLTPEKIAILMGNIPCYDLIPYMNNNDYKTILYLMRVNRKLHLNENEAVPPQDLISLLDCCYNVMSGKFLERDSSLFFRTYICVSASDIRLHKGEKFEAYIGGITNGDPNHRKLLLEVIGVCISRMFAKSFFVVVGPTDSGKTLFGKLIMKLIGDENCFPINDLNELTEKFALSSFTDINLCIGLDLPDIVIKKKAISILKMLTGGDLVRAQAKYQNSFSFKNEAKILLGTNHIPKIMDPEKETAFYNRMVVVPFLYSVPKEDQNRNLLVELLDEKGYIVCKALEALQELIARNFEFSTIDVPGESFLYKRESQSNKSCKISEIVYQFISDKCVFNPDAKTLISSLYESYIAFCGEHGFATTNDSGFSRIIANRYTMLISYREKSSELRGYKGIALK